ncbi:MAG: response regulator [Candidatus Sulfotelmatobacter sp.]|jgi:CheY-like chemotaxis protein
MTLESLLVSGDASVVRVLRPTLEKLSITVEVCQEAKQASEILISEKFDAVIIDCDDLRGGLEVLQCLRATPSNRNSIAFAVLNGKKTTTQEAFGMGVNFVLQKPISSLNASRCFHAALSFMERERRRYFRHPLKMPVKVVLEEKELKATSTNISERGIALMLHHAIPKNANPRLQFMLPETKMALEIEAEVAWADLKGHAGLRFLKVPQSSQELLEKWLSERIEQLPGGAENPAATSPSAIQ